MNFSQFEKGKALSSLTTFGIGGEAQFYIEVTQIDQMQAVLQFCQLESLPFFILGKGSNILFDDRGYKGVVIANRIHFLEHADGRFRAGAGYSFSLLGTQTARQGWAGLEFASGIPGSVGGAVYMNAGANGSETADTLVEVEFVNQSGERVRYMREQLEFSYRTSSFQSMS
jgi:UDP-N-acetylmuramate dehydrogenase